MKKKPENMKTEKKKKKKNGTLTSIGGTATRIK